MPSDDRFEPLDLEEGVPTTPEDVAALRRARQRNVLSTEDFLRFLDQLPRPSRAALRSRRGPRGDEPFKL
jgi:hypothetical protein